MSDDVKILDQTNKYDGYIRVDNIRLRHRLTTGELGPPITRDLIRTNRAVGVLPYDPIRDEVVFIRQFRIGPWGAGESPWLVECVAGVIDEGEVPEMTARRETLEETGCTVQELHYVSEYYSSPGLLTEHMKLYCGIIDTTKAGGNYGLADEGEDIESFVKPWEEAWNEVQTGKIQDAKLLLIMMWLSQKKNRYFAMGASETLCMALSPCV
jgi:ADP-ribose pyrophosphatase